MLLLSGLIYKLIRIVLTSYSSVQQVRDGPLKILLLFRMGPAAINLPNFMPVKHVSILTRLWQAEKISFP